MQRVVFEMETSDPDDFMTLLWLADHPDVDLLAVLVTPGSRDQCQLVRWQGPARAPADPARPLGAARRLRRRQPRRRALDRYLHDKGVGKAMHDVVAAACVLDERVCEFAEVEIYREKGEWGARAPAGTNTWISIGFDEDRFLTTLAR